MRLVRRLYHKLFEAVAGLSEIWYQVCAFLMYIGWCGQEEGLYY